MSAFKTQDFVVVTDRNILKCAKAKQCSPRAARTQVFLSIGRKWQSKPFTSLVLGKCPGQSWATSATDYNTQGLETNLLRQWEDQQCSWYKYSYIQGMQTTERYRPKKDMQNNYGTV